MSDCHNSLVAFKTTKQIMNLRPSEIRFSQNSIKNVFDKRCVHSNKKLTDTLEDLSTGKCNISDIPKITVFKKDEVWYTLDNRRLWVFQRLEEKNKCEEIPVKIGSSIPGRKMTTTNDGKYVHVRTGVVTRTRRRPYR